MAGEILEEARKELFDDTTRLQLSLSVSFNTKQMFQTANSLNACYYILLACENCLPLIIAKPCQPGIVVRASEPSCPPPRTKERYGFNRH